MTGLAQGLKVARCEEQILVALMGLYVVGHIGWRHPALILAEPAQWLMLELSSPQLLPLLGVVQVMPGAITAHRV